MGWKLLICEIGVFELGKVYDYFVAMLRISLYFYSTDLNRMQI